MLTRGDTVPLLKACVLGIFFVCSDYGEFRTFIRTCQILGNGTELEDLYKTQAESGWSDREKADPPLVGQKRPKCSDSRFLARAGFVPHEMTFKSISMRNFKQKFSLRLKTDYFLVFLVLL